MHGMMHMRGSPRGRLADLDLVGDGEAAARTHEPVHLGQVPLRQHHLPSEGERR